MLALTDNAVQAVRNILSSSEEVPTTAGLRMTAEQEGAQANLRLAVVPSPEAEDAVIDEEGARVFLEPEAAVLLDDKVLDARVEADHVAFTIADQPEM